MQTPNRDPRAKAIENAGQRVGIPVSPEHADLAATWGDSVYNSFDVVRSLNYQMHEPSNVFNPVVIEPNSDDEKEVQ